MPRWSPIAQGWVPLTLRSTVVALATFLACSPASPPAPPATRPARRPVAVPRWSPIAQGWVPLTLRSAVVLVAFLACSPSSPPPPPATTVAGRAAADTHAEPEAADADAEAVAEAAPANSAEMESEEPEVVDDAGDEQPAPAADTELKLRPHPLDEWSSERIRAAVKDDLGSLGSISIGSPNAGALLNGRLAEGGQLLTLVDAAHAFGTEETLAYLTAAIRRVHEQFADTAPLSLGHISAARGGPIRPHVSHQSGRDVDISFYYANGARWYARATEANLDLARTWAFVRALIVETDVEMILVDQQIQTYLRRYAASKGEDPTWLASVFQGQGASRPILRHARGHATHLHIRFFNPIAQETARRAHAALVAEHVIPELVSFVRHRARRGDTLAKIAKKYGVSVAAIRQLNGLKNSRIRENREYRIPIRAKAPPIASEPLRFPPRRLPPDPRVANSN